MNQTRNAVMGTAATLAGEDVGTLAEIHDMCESDRSLLAEANAIIGRLPLRQASTLRRAFRASARYGGMDPVEAEAASRLARDSCRLAARMTA